MANKASNGPETNVTMTMSLNHLDEVQIEYAVEKFARGRDPGDEVGLCETEPFETQFPGCRLRWRARYFGDTFHESPRHSSSLELLSHRPESSLFSRDCPELKSVTVTCCLVTSGAWTHTLSSRTLALRDARKLPIKWNDELNESGFEKRLTRWRDYPANFRVLVRAQFRPNDLSFIYKREDFRTPRIVRSFHEEEEITSLQESFRIFNDITARTYKFEKFANYGNSEWLALLQSKPFVTRFPLCKLTWRARFFRDTYQEPCRHSVGLQLLGCEMDETQRVQIRATCELHIGRSRQTALEAEFHLERGQGVPVVKTSGLDGDTIENLVIEASNFLRVGLVVNFTVYESRVSTA